MYIWQVYNGNQGSQEESLNTQNGANIPDVQLGEGPQIPSQEVSIVGKWAPHICEMLVLSNVLLQTNAD